MAVERKVKFVFGCLSIGMDPTPEVIDRTVTVSVVSNELQEVI